MVGVVEEVEEHVHDNDIHLARSEPRHQIAGHKLVVGGEDVVDEEVVLWENGAIAPELVAQIFVFGKEVGGVEFAGGRAVEDGFTKVLAHAGAEVEEGVAGFEAWEDDGVVERVFGEAEGEPPEFADAGPRKDAPGFVALGGGGGGLVWRGGRMIWGGWKLKGGLLFGRCGFPLPPGGSCCIALATRERRLSARS